MTPTFVAVLPAIIPDLARRCIDSMAPELRARLLLVDNTDTGEIAEEHAGKVMFVVKEGKNRGSTHAWNDGLAMADAQSADWTYIISQSVEFGAAGGLDLFDACDSEEHIIHSQFGWHGLLIARKVWEEVGRFDPVFASYGADTDYLYRLGLADLPSPRENGRTLTQSHLNASCAPNGMCLRTGVVKEPYHEHLDAYAAKWGDAQGVEKWVHPYGVDSLDWTYVGKPVARSSQS